MNIMDIWQPAINSEHSLRREPGIGLLEAAKYYGPRTIMNMGNDYESILRMVGMNIKIWFINGVDNVN